MKTLQRKLVIVGDHGVGKTSVLTAVVERTLPTDFSAILYGGVQMEVRVDGKIVNLRFWNTPNGEDYERLRPLCYPDSAIIVICFAMDDIQSLQNVTEKWYPEVAHFAQGVPILLLACKTDLRIPGEGGEGFSSTMKRTFDVSREQAHAVASAIGAVRYMECSAQMDHGIQEFLQASAEIAGSWDPIPKRPHRSPCQIL